MTAFNSAKRLSVFAFELLLLCGCSGGGQTVNAQPVPPPGVGISQPTENKIAAGTFTVEGNSETVAGIDSAGRGYRDDVAQLIEDKFSVDPIVKVGAALIAISYQKSIAKPLIPGQDTSNMVMQSGQDSVCALRVVGLARDQAFFKAMRAIYARTFNTDARMAARQAYVNAAENVISQGVDPKNCVTPKQ